MARATPRRGGGRPRPLERLPGGRQRGCPPRPPGRRPLAPPPQPRPWTRGVPALRKRSAIGRVAASGTGGEEEWLAGCIGDDGVWSSSVRLGRPYGSIEGPVQKRHERLVERWEEIRRLHLAGARVKDIAQWVGTSQSTVYRYREMAEPPPRPCSHAQG